MYNQPYCITPTGSHFLMSIECQEHITYNTVLVTDAIFDFVWPPVPAGIKRFTFTLQGTDGYLRDAYMMLSPTDQPPPVGIPKIGTIGLF